MLENRVLRRIFGRKREQVIGEWRELDNEELNDLHSSLKTILVINQEGDGRGMWHVWKTGEVRTVWRPRENNHLEDLCVDGSMNLNVN
jgi:hypothetical protein